MNRLRRIWAERNPPPQPDRGLMVVLAVYAFGVAGYRLYFGHSLLEPGGMSLASLAWAGLVVVLAIRSGRRQSATR